MWEGIDAFASSMTGARAQRSASDNFALAFARIECHYFINRASSNATTSSSRTPAGSAHPRHHRPRPLRRCTPLRNAWDLAKAWPEADLRIVPDSGHAMTEPGIVHELVTATDKYAPKESGFSS